VTQERLVDPAQAEAAKEEAITNVGAHASPAWKQEALRAVYAVCRRRLRDGTQEFTTDSVAELLRRWQVDAPREPRVYGAVMRIASTRRWCVATSRFQVSDDVVSHRRPKRVWRVLDTIADWDGQA
jgi:hypothetical protein